MKSEDKVEAQEKNLSKMESSHNQTKTGKIRERIAKSILGDKKEETGEKLEDLEGPTGEVQKMSGDKRGSNEILELLCSYD
jgi:hypothetical protein